MSRLGTVALDLGGAMCDSTRFSTTDFHISQIADPGYDRCRNGLVGLGSECLGGRFDALPVGQLCGLDRSRECGDGAHRGIRCCVCTRGC